VTSIEKARQLRKDSTDAERMLWQHLRARQIDGCKFRRQRPVGPYIADFVCVERKLILELDGGQHAENKAYDNRRTEWLESEGFRVLRFWNNDVLEDVESVKQAVLMALEGGGEPSP
jgi:very-short-patch-repair endonuclease